MAGTPTHNFMNWANVTATAQTQGATAITIKEVDEVQPNLDATMEKFYGDNRRFPKCIRATEFVREASITTGDVATANSLVPGVPYTLTATMCDAFNGTGTGAVTYTLKNCVLKKNGLKAANNKFGMVTIDFEAYADDDDSDPFTFVVAS